ncbi:MAG: HD domain-containing protein [Bdellovibrio sp.]|nr:HD domain-containing protein [Bdellovibrio sp.]
MEKSPNTKNEIEYVSFPILKIFPEQALPGELYLFLNGHFVKYKTKEDSISQQKFELFVLQKVQYVFISKEDAPAYKAWSERLSGKVKEELISGVGQDNVGVVEQHLEIRDEYLSFVSKEVTEESVKEVLTKTRNFIQTIKEKHTADKFTAKLLSYSQHVADHSTNVANLSVFLALNTGYSQQLILENIYLGGLLHDFGKTKIDAKILEEPPTSKKYQTAIRKHPELGKTSLLLDSGFSDEILRIVGEHHERQDGTGYPKGLKGNKIYDLTKIISIANVFDNLVMSTQGEIKGRQIKAFRFLESDQGKMFDPKILGKCLRALERVII